jgi:hypothetical protein
MSWVAAPERTHRCKTAPLYIETWSKMEYRGCELEPNNLDFSAMNYKKPMITYYWIPKFIQETPVRAAKPLPVMKMGANGNFFYYSFDLSVNIITTALGPCTC